MGYIKSTEKMSYQEIDNKEKNERFVKAMQKAMNSDKYI